jgi:hypothetical protein
VAAGPPPGKQSVPSGLHIPEGQSSSRLALQLPWLQVGVTSESIGQVVVPQIVPAGRFVLSTHSDTPVAHEVTPVLHGLVGVHGWFAVQVPQVPEWQTLLAPQVVPSVATRQAPLPLHVPVSQSAGVTPQAASAVPAATLAQVPGVARLQAMQVPHLALEQHTPSTQLPLEHSATPPQAVPSGFLATQTPATQ